MGEKVVSRKVLFRICGQWQLWQINSKTCKSYSKSKVNVGSVCSSCVLWSNQCDDSHLCLCSLVSLVSPGVLSIHIPPSLTLFVGPLFIVCSVGLWVFLPAPVSVFLVLNFPARILDFENLFYALWREFTAFGSCLLPRTMAEVDGALLRGRKNCINTDYQLSVSNPVLRVSQFWVSGGAKAPTHVQKCHCSISTSHTKKSPWMLCVGSRQSMQSLFSSAKQN